MIVRSVQPSKTSKDPIHKAIFTNLATNETVDILEINKQKKRLKRKRYRFSLKKRETESLKIEQSSAEEQLNESI